MPVADFSVPGWREIILGSEVMQDRVAIVGMSIKASGARNIDEYWNLVRNGMSGRRWLSHDELARREIPYRRYTHPDFVPVTYPLEECLEFDAEAFRFSALEAEFTDPQHRLMLEACYRAVEHSGHSISMLPGTVGVYLGAKSSSHGPLLEQALADEPDMLAMTRLAVGNHPDYLASRLAYKFGLTGPAITVQTACSTSAVAIHLAAQAILAGECDSAVAGGAAIDLQDAGYLYAESGIYSRRGRCEPFMTSADGTVEGNGVAVLYLRRLDDALADGDSIFAVLTATVVNNDGRTRAGFSAPGVEGQTAVIEEALDIAELKAQDIGMFEAHGTGTRIGDALEIEAASHAYLAHGAPLGGCRLTSVKANVGHMSAAAGAAGVIAAVLALLHEEIPPNEPLLRGGQPVDLSSTPFSLSDRAQPWRRGSTPRYAAVSSFGLGGTNAHLVLGEFDIDDLARRGERRAWQLLPLSADDTSRLAETVEATRLLVDTASDDQRHDVGHTLRTGRVPLAVRTSVVVPAGATRTAVRWPDAESFVSAEGPAPDVVYLLPGQGGRAAEAARQLYAGEPWFRRTVDRGLDVARAVVDDDTYARIRAAFEDGSHTADTQVAQPVLHLTGLGVHSVLGRLGVRPAAILGHSVGEVTGACLSGIMSFEDATRAVCRRAAAMADMPPGTMFAVRAAAEDLRGLPEECVVAAVNAPRACVVSSSLDAVPALTAWLDEQAVEHRRLDTSHAFHHPSMTEAAARFARYLERLDLAAPGTPLMSCRSGAWLTGFEAMDPAYWGSQLRDRVEFARAVRTVIKERPGAVFVQLGAGTSLIRALQLGGADPGRCLALMPGEDADAHQTLLSVVGRLWERGVPVDWSAYAEHDRGLRVPGPPRIFRRTPVLHPRLAGKTPAIDPVLLGTPASAHSPAPVPPQDTDEQLQPLMDAVARCWAEVLGATPAPDDDFISQGGDSISAGQLAVRLRALFPVDVPVHLPLTARTPKAIAQSLDDLLISSVTTG
ncbi:type I polyketide synthase [Streptomyces sp. NPDC048187]|uniref:type I polyketide synthase n=2 Tax=Streptomyces TaxID=1883 RepID=UPI00371E311A